MPRAILSSWPLFFGLAMIMIGNGLQGTLLGVRATLEDFGTTTIGLVMSLYFVGFLVGSWYVPRLVEGVGHIRVFAALASLASTTVLLHGIFLSPWVWGAVRIVTGFSYAGLFIVIESWLNNEATNKTRGKIMALYLITLYLGMTIGQFLLNLASPADIQLFILTSVLVSLALLPISLSRRPAPVFIQPETVPLKKLYATSPLGLAGVFGTGLTNSTIMTIGAVYAAKIGFGLGEISFFMASFILGGVIFQWPIGWLSDRFDRRKVLIGASALSCLLATGCFFISGSESLSSLLPLAMLCFGGTALSLYGLSVAHTNDHLLPEQILSVSSTLLLINGFAACIGPFLVSALMGGIGVFVFFPSVAIIYGMIAVFGLYRMSISQPVPLEEQGDFVALPVRHSPIAMMIAEDSTETLKEMDKKAGNSS